LPLAIKCMNLLALEYGYKPIEASEARKMFRDKSMRDIIHDFGLKFYQLPRYVIKAKKIFNENLSEVNIFPDIKEMLKALVEKYKIFIITSNAQETVMFALDKAGIRTYIKEIYSNSSIFGKHVVIKDFLKNHKLSADEIIYIGDEIRDIEACKKIGVKMIAVTWGYNSRSALEQSKPDYLVDSCDEIRKLLGTL
jgi:phosphoglycolate phosphatase